MDHAALRETYRKANEYRKTPFLERPYFGSPGAPAQAENNASNIWGHINGGFLFAYEYTRWWKESRALRQTAILGDWSWLNKCIVSGADALSTNGSNGGPGTSNWRKTARTEALQ